MLNLKRNLICGKMTRLNEISVGVEYIIGERHIILRKFFRR
jgi:hypothetical protein